MATNITRTIASNEVKAYRIEVNNGTPSVYSVGSVWVDASTLTDAQARRALKNAGIQVFKTDTVSITPFGGKKYTMPVKTFIQHAEIGAPAAGYVSRTMSVCIATAWGIRAVDGSNVPEVYPIATVEYDACGKTNERAARAAFEEEHMNVPRSAFIMIDQGNEQSYRMSIADFAYYGKELDA